MECFRNKIILTPIKQKDLLTYPQLKEYSKSFFEKNKIDFKNQINNVLKSQNLRDLLVTAVNFESLQLNRKLINKNIQLDNGQTSITIELASLKNQINHYISKTNAKINHHLFEIAQVFLEECRRKNDYESWEVNASKSIDGCVQ